MEKREEWVGGDGGKMREVGRRTEEGENKGGAEVELERKDEGKEKRKDTGDGSD
jgi:hypothetical protein